MPTILFVGGGSVGHIAPSVAVWRAIEAKESRSTAHFVCLDRPDEQEFLRAENLVHSTIDAPRLSLKFLWQFPLAYWRARTILKQVDPQVVFSKGGYVSVPLCLAAKHKKIPIVLHESDSVSGRANRFVGKFASVVCEGFPGKHTYTGNPIRPSITQGDPEEARRLTGLSGDKPVLLVMGGSQGARAINDSIYVHLDRILEHCQVIHITGRGKEHEIDVPGYFAASFVTSELPHFYALADLVISRAGAGSIAEIAANGLPAILVPLRGVANDHQQRNAEILNEVEACVMPEEDLIVWKCGALVEKLIHADAKLQRLRENIRAFAAPDAADKIAEIALASAGKAN